MVHRTDLPSLCDLHVLEPARDQVLVLILGVDHHRGAELVCDCLRSVPAVEARLHVELA